MVLNIPSLILSQKLQFRLHVNSIRGFCSFYDTRRLSFSSLPLTLHPWERRKIKEKQRKPKTQERKIKILNPITIHQKQNKLKDENIPPSLFTRLLNQIRETFNV